jgi:hypothetical protein
MPPPGCSLDLENITYSASTDTSTLIFNVAYLPTQVSVPAYPRVTTWCLHHWHVQPPVQRQSPHLPACPPLQCDSSDPSNTYDCCDHDIKSILLGLKSSLVTGISSTPNDLLASYTAVDSGISVVGLFGQSLAFSLTVTVSGQHSVSSLSTGNTYPGDGFRWALRCARPSSAGHCLPPIPEPCSICSLPASPTCTHAGTACMAAQICACQRSAAPPT